MAATVTKITCKFIGDFKVGDNLILNADALCKLSNGNEKGVFNKPMVIQAGSIVEAAILICQRAQVRLDWRPPSRWARLPTPVLAAKAGPMPTNEGLGLDDREDLQD